MKILVLGGAGYIGSHTVSELVDAGEEVVIADSLETGHIEAVNPKAKFYQGDIRDKKFIDSVFDNEKIDAVIHFAANSLNAYAKEICDALKANKVRVDLDDRSEKLGYRMREGQIQKVPYLLVVGFNEKDERTVSFRLHGEKKTTVLPLDEFVEKLDTEIKGKLRTHIGM